MALGAKSPESQFFFSIGRVPHILETSWDTLSWKSMPGAVLSYGKLSFYDIFGVEQNKRWGGTLAVILHYAGNKSSPKLSHEKLVMITQDRLTAETFLTTIKDRLNTFQQRPKSCLVFVNPVSGTEDGDYIWKEDVLPKFKSAGVKTHVIVTKTEDHSKEVLTNYNLDKVDSIIVVGGDGTLGKVVHHLLIRTAMDAGKDIEDPDIEWVRPKQWIGVIPTGSGQKSNLALTGTTDVVTATLHILLGSHYLHNLAFVYNGEGKLYSCATLFLGYGLFGEIPYFTRRHRYLGWGRLPAALFKYLICGPTLSYDLEISYEPASGANGTSVPAAARAEAPDTCLKLKGEFAGINLCSTPCLLGRGEEESLLCLQLLRAGYSGADLLNHWIRVTSLMDDALEFAGMEYVACKSVKVKLKGEYSDVIAIDGKIYDVTDDTLDIKFVPGLLNMFGNVDIFYEKYGLIISKRTKENKDNTKDVREDTIV